VLSVIGRSGSERFFVFRSGQYGSMRQDLPVFGPMGGECAVAALRTAFAHLTRMEKSGGCSGVWPARVRIVNNAILWRVAAKLGITVYRPSAAEWQQKHPVHGMSVHSLAKGPYPDC
jgi:hypothetical protein